MHARKSQRKLTHTTAEAMQREQNCCDFQRKLLLEEMLVTADDNVCHEPDLRKNTKNRTTIQNEENSVYYSSISQFKG